MKKSNFLLRRKLRRTATMTAGMFWSDFAIRIISYLCAVIIMAMVLSVTLPMTTEEITLLANQLAIVLAVLWCIPVLRNTRRRLRDAGYSAKAYLWLLLPGIGWLIFVVLLCVKHAPNKKETTQH